MWTIGGYLLNVLEAGVLGAVASLILTYVEPKWPWFQSLDKVGKVAVTAALCLVMVSASFVIIVVMQELPAPPDWRALADTIFGYSMWAMFGSQGTHAIVKAVSKE